MNLFIRLLASAERPNIAQVKLNFVPRGIGREADKGKILLD